MTSSNPWKDAEKDTYVKASDKTHKGWPGIVTDELGEEVAHLDVG